MKLERNAMYDNGRLSPLKMYSTAPQLNNSWTFLRRGEIGSELTQSQSQCRAKSNEAEMNGSSLLSIYLKNLLGDLRWEFSCK